MSPPIQKSRKVHFSELLAPRDQSKRSLGGVDWAPAWPTPLELAVKKGEVLFSFKYMPASLAEMKERIEFYRRQLDSRSA